MGKKKCEAKVVCRGCGKVIFLTDGKPLCKKKKVKCPHCEAKNKVIVGKNGRIKLYCVSVA